MIPALFCCIQNRSHIAFLYTPAVVVLRTRGHTTFLLAYLYGIFTVTLLIGRARTFESLGIAHLGPEQTCEYPELHKDNEHRNKILHVARTVNGVNIITFPYSRMPQYRISPNKAVILNKEEALQGKKRGAFVNRLK